MSVRVPLPFCEEEVDASGEEEAEEEDRDVGEVLLVLDFLLWELGVPRLSGYASAEPFLRSVCCRLSSWSSFSCKRSAICRSASSW